MQFLPGTTLPSASELKAKFARFGPLDTSRIRISWAKSTCRLVFNKKCEAEEAYTYVVNKKLFGQTKVNYWLQPEISTTELNLGNAPVNPIVRRYHEIYAKYREKADRSHV
ncbi:putative non-specific serine/threonine protein kinase [Helianthus annuus]|nr:putative non-specific serine/threonine protein kinase [Helianthus annuus]KAJ0635104.1 putative non-specific serine/threonine protein kinase [Helianthus annuus]KAJ0824842.1 putative non-specific serine/threonine protein kinase [Helianthus annuus]